MLRILLIPFFIFFYYLETGNIRYTACIIFLVASLTDFLDGFLSRIWKVESRFGAMMDPIADKLIVVTALCLVVGDSPFLAIPIILIICREIFVSGLREFLGKSDDIEMPVSVLAKYKTASQMLAVTFLTLTAGFNATESQSVKNVFYFGVFVLIISCILTVLTGLQYFKIAKDKI